MLGHQFAVAGDDLDRNAALPEGGQRAAGTLLGRVEKGGEAGEDEFRFIADDAASFTDAYRELTHGRGEIIWEDPIIT